MTQVRVLKRGKSAAISFAPVAPRFFGQYLVSLGVISELQLNQAVAVVCASNLTLGARAVAAGLMTVEQVQEIAHLQRSVNARWGELSLNLGYLDEVQLQRLLAEQSAQSIKIGEVLVRQNALSAAERDLHLRDFLALERHYGLVSSQVTAIRNLDEENSIASLIGPLALRTAGISLKVGVPASWRRSEAAGVAAVIPVDSPTFATSIGLALTQPLASAIASGLLGLESDELDEEMTRDGICEFLNILAGHYKNHRQSCGDKVKLGLPTPDTLPDLGVCHSIEGLAGQGQLVINIAAHREAMIPANLSAASASDAA
jgi:hypothetical protein